ncbi:hypothetical protein [Alicyclobacillus fastidiosus]|uniref:Uncharacterized protein n=1 Tax=Alicyclobacillus fastidiosus TaxID=392011 RepID=A0ABV5AGI7_9BACL|nr:hypothetical protein [Alicyclobacillus fastidiosus]WEH07968.1 hypothetical protein PYS47_14535 [Alicyclobacillus fastidiosus]
MSQDPTISQKHAANLAVMTSELDRAHEIISDYLDFARPKPDKTHALDVSSHIPHVVQVLTPYANSTSVVIEGARNLFGTSGRFDQPLMNVIKNAIEVMPGGGRVLVQARRGKHAI